MHTKPSYRLARINELQMLFSKVVKESLKLNIVPLVPFVEHSFQPLNSNIIIDLRSGSERRIHADRRKEKRVGEVADRRQQSERRVN